MAARIPDAQLARFKAKVLARYPAAAKAKLKKANQQNAGEFARRVEPIIPREDGSDPRRQPGTLAATLEVKDVGDLGAGVSLGGPSAPFPLHLEGGHRNKDGSHTPATKFWNPTKRLTKKPAKARQARAIREAAKIAAGSGS